MLTVVACHRTSGLHSFTFSGLGTALTVTYTGLRNEKMEKEIKKEVARIENEASYYRSSSFVYRFNHMKRSDVLRVPHWLCVLTNTALSLGKKTGNAFDITYKVKGRLWEDNDVVPSDKTLNALQPLVGPDLVQADCMHDVLRKTKDGVLIDLGGIAKGYAIDYTGGIMRRYRISDFIINYGGDMLVCGSKFHAPWKIGIKHPDISGKMLKVFTIPIGSCVALATSGDYERFFERNGKKYSHIIDPETGHPVQYAHSITVKGKKATVVDLLATAISVRSQNQAFIKKIVASFSVAVYTLSGSPLRWREWTSKKDEGN